MAKPTKQKPKPEDSFTGITLQQWRSDTSRLRWAQQERLFKEIVSVVQNEAYVALFRRPEDTENCMFGQCKGYHLALEVLRQMAEKIAKPAPQPEPEYLPDDEELRQRKADVHD